MGCGCGAASSGSQIPGTAKVVTSPGGSIGASWSSTKPRLDKSFSASAADEVVPLNNILASQVAASNEQQVEDQDFGCVGDGSPIFVRPGCGKPTWNRPLDGEFCSTTCKASELGPLCLRPGCGKPTWNGQSNEFCSRTCRSGGSVAALCARAGCGQPTWNGQPGEFCSRTCRNGGALSQALPDDVHFLEEIDDQNFLKEVQALLVATHKASNNWTRDRGCRKHGRNNCSDTCIMSNPAAVPEGYCVTAVERNHNTHLWREYSQARTVIMGDWSASRACSQHVVASSRPPFDVLGQSIGVEPLLAECNEWFLFHGTDRHACEGICRSGIQIGMAGSGATFKVQGRPKRPLYGWGAYFAEMITKSDEYARPWGYRYCVVLCRVVGGIPLLVTEDTIPEQMLKSQVIAGPHHSVVGDRVTRLGKPYREMVVYSSDQIFPELIITYRRL